MAIDSAAKRQSAMMVFVPIHSRVPLPDGTVGQIDRQTLIMMYGGILAGVIIIATGLAKVTFTHGVIGTTFTHKKPGGSFTHKKPGVDFT